MEKMISPFSFKFTEKCLRVINLSGGYSGWVQITTPVNKYIESNVVDIENVNLDKINAQFSSSSEPTWIILYKNKGNENYVSTKVVTSNRSFSFGSYNVIGATLICIVSGSQVNLNM